MLKGHEGALPPVGQRPIWCDSNNAGDWWLPWREYTVLTVLAQDGGYVPVLEIGRRCELSPPLTVGALTSLAWLGLVGEAEEDEVDPDGWAEAHGEECLCPRRSFYTMTGRGHLWLTAVPARARQRRRRWWHSRFLWVVMALGALSWWLTILAG